MRQTFIVGSKLMGILMLYWTITGTLQMVALSRPVTGYSNLDLTQYLLTAISLVFGLLLTFSSGVVAHLVGMGVDKNLPTIAKDRELLRIGIVLIGLFLTVSRLANILDRVAHIGDSVAGWTLQDTIIVFGQLVPLYLLFCSNQITAWLWPAADSAGQN